MAVPGLYFPTGKLYEYQIYMIKAYPYIPTPRFSAFSPCTYDSGLAFKMVRLADTNHTVVALCSSTFTPCSPHCLHRQEHHKNFEDYCQKRLAQLSMWKPPAKSGTSVGYWWVIVAMLSWQFLSSLVMVVVLSILSLVVSPLTHWRWSSLSLAMRDRQLCTKCRAHLWMIGKRGKVVQWLEKWQV